MQRTSLTACIAALMAGGTAPVHAQAQDSARATAGGRSEFAIDAGILALGLSYARRLGTSRFSIGGGGWGAWEPGVSVEHAVLEPVGLLAFARYRPSKYAHADLGIGHLWYRTSDDCSGCSASFTGMRATVLVGYRFVFVGPDFWIGSFDGGRRGAAFGYMPGVQLRFLIGHQPQ